MAAHRYWRALGLEAYGLAGLDISEFQLLAVATRVDASATLTSTIAPATGALDALKDDDTSTGATWSAADLKTLVLSWDFGVGGGQDVTDIRIGSSADATKFLLVAKLQWSDDAATWTDFYTFVGIAWPGKRAKTLSDGTQSAQVLASAPLLYYKLDEVSGTAYADATGNGRTGTGSGTITPQAGLNADSSGSQIFGATTAQILTADPFGSAYAGAWTVRGFIKATSSGGVLANRGRDGFGGWSISVNILATTGVISASAVYAGSGYTASSAAGAYTYGTAAEVVAQYVVGTGLRLFLNGVLVAAAAVPGGGALRDSTIGLTVGMGNGSGVAGTECDEVAWWNTALTVAQIRSLANPGKIARNLVAGRTAFSTPFDVPSAVSIALPYGAVNMRPYNIRGRRDFTTGVLGQGIGRVKGTTKDKGSPNVPVSERVRLYREVDGLLVREAWSTAGTGAYSFDYVDEMQTYTVISYDHDKAYRAVVADGLSLANGGVEVIA